MFANDVDPPGGPEEAGSVAKALPEGLNKVGGKGLVRLSGVMALPTQSQ